MLLGLIGVVAPNVRFWELVLEHCSLSVPGFQGRLNKGFIYLGISIHEVIYNDYGFIACTYSTLS